MAPKPAYLGNRRISAPLYRRMQMLWRSVLLPRRKRHGWALRDALRRAPPGQGDAVVLIGDGSHNLDPPDPLDAAAMLAERGVPLYTVGMGREEVGGRMALCTVPMRSRGRAGRTQVEGACLNARRSVVEEGGGSIPPRRCPCLPSGPAPCLRRAEGRPALAVASWTHRRRGGPAEATGGRVV